MKIILSILIIGFGILFSNSFSFSKSENGHGGRCTGSANCTACSNCSRCGHCSSGGACGVCSGGSSGRSLYSTQRKSYPNSLNSSRKNIKIKKAALPSIKYFDENGETIVKTMTDITNVRKSASLKAEIIEKVEKNSYLILLQNSGKWLKVKVKNSGKIGFVYYKNLN